MFESVERARIEALGANRMPGMASNLTARVEDQYGHGRYAEITERADAPLEDALALIVRERLTGAAPPETAKAMVELWRPFIEDRAGRTLARMEKLAENQETFGRQYVRQFLGTRDEIDRHWPHHKFTAFAIPGARHRRGTDPIVVIRHLTSCDVH